MLLFLLPGLFNPRAVNPDLIRCDCQYSAMSEVRLEAFQHSYAVLRLLATRDIDQPNDATMRFTVENGQTAKVLLKSDRGAAFVLSLAHDLLVSRIRIGLTHPAHIVPGRGQDRGRPAPDAGVQQELHAAALTISGSIRSCSTNRCA